MTKTKDEIKRSISRIAEDTSVDVAVTRDDLEEIRDHVSDLLANLPAE